MKKLSILIIILLLAISSEAQVLRSVGIKLGFTLSSQDWKYSNLSSISSWNPDSKLGFNGGLFAEFLNDNIFTIVTELNFLEKGAEYEMPVTTADNPDGTGQTILWNASLTYLNFSLLGKARYDMGAITPYLIAGPYLDIELNKSDELSYQDADKNRLGLKAGIGSEINILPVKLIVEFVYQYDFDSFNKTELLEITSQAFDIRVGVML